MYKSRLKQWGLRKNYRYEEVNEIIRQQATRVSAGKSAGSSGVAGSRVRKGDGRRGRLYRRPLESAVVRVGWKATKNNADAPLSPSSVVAVLRQLSPLGTASPRCRVPTPKGQPEISFLFPLTPPPDLRYPEECQFHITRYCEGAFEKGLWELETPKWMETNRSIVDWFNRIALARGALAGGHTQQGFKLLQICFDEYKDLIINQDPRLMLYTTNAIFLLVEYPDVVAMMMKYIANLSKIMQGPLHPLHQIMASLERMGLTTMMEYARLIFNAQISEFERYLPKDNEVLQSMTVFAIRNLAVSGLIDTEVAEAKLRVFPRGGKGDNGRISMALAQVLMMGARYSEARKICNELLESGTDRARTLAGGFDTLFLICRLEGKEEYIRDASIRRINFTLKTFGPESDWTVDACSDYEKYLRDIDDIEGADKVFSDFGVYMDKLTEGVMQLEIK